MLIRILVWVIALWFISHPFMRRASYPWPLIPGDRHSRGSDIILAISGVFIIVMAILWRSP
jgi:hypothetical protein